MSLRTAEVRQFKSWLYTVTKNHCLMQLRRTNSHHSLTELRTLENLVDETSEVDHWPLIERGMDTLPAEQQRCLQLFYLEQKSYQEVAALTGYELKKVKSYLQNGKRNLKIFVQKHA